MIWLSMLGPTNCSAVYRSCITTAARMRTRCRTHTVASSGAALAPSRAAASNGRSAAVTAGSAAHGGAIQIAIRADDQSSPRTKAVDPVERSQCGQRAAQRELEDRAVVPRPEGQPALVPPVKVVP